MAGSSKAPYVIIALLAIIALIMSIIIAIKIRPIFSLYSNMSWINVGIIAIIILIAVIGLFAFTSTTCPKVECKTANVPTAVSVVPVVSPYPGVSPQSIFFQ
jgi:hypothetical protein